MTTEAVVGGIRRPEKLTELSFAADHYEATGFGHGGALDTGRTVLYRSQASNPDLIVDAPEQQLPQPPVVAHHQPAKRSASGEYRRTADDSLYSPGFWTASDAAANDRTPIIEKSPPLPAQSAAAVCTVRETVAAVPDPKAASLRVWKHGVQVMPPLSALKRALNKGSPDEGYQEGCGTDV